MRALVSGAAGFVGSHVVDRLLADGFDVVGVDNLMTGRLTNLRHLESNERFTLTVADVSEALSWPDPFDWVLHFASPASPVHYRVNELATLRVNGEGTRRMLDLAADEGARFLLASTSEVYGDAQVHPQPETYNGNVSPWGPRSVYQESKRYAEALTAAYSRSRRVPVRIARIFNTYGPRMRPDDGRAVPTFVGQALAGEPMTVNGDGSQTRSLQYVIDLVEGLRRLMEVDYVGPVNLGSPSEIGMRQLAELIREMAGSSSTIETAPIPTDEPRRRCPDISLCRRLLGWEPVIPLTEGLPATIADLSSEVARVPFESWPVAAD